MVKTIAVIGAGAAGLCALKHLTTLSIKGQFEVVAFERYPYLGGMWVYTDRVGQDEDGLPVHSSLYRDLRTNLPKDVMMFPDFPFRKRFPSFPGHWEVLEYLQFYADHYQLQKHIKFSTLVTRVHPISPESRDTRWEVSYCSVKNRNQCETKDFDHVWICNGHYSVPIIPEIPGRAKFMGKVMHIHDYRTSDAFKGKSVAILGAGPSGFDVCVELAKTVKKLIFSHFDVPFQLELPDNCYHKPTIQRLTERSVVFEDETEEQADAVIFCTGYIYNFPFLTEACQVVVKDNGRRVTPLYKHFIHTRYPSMAFVGLTHFTIPFTVIDLQVKCLVKVLDGSLALPSTKEMEEDTQKALEEHISSGFPTKRFHRFFMIHFSYYEALCEMADLNKPPEGRRALYDQVLSTLLASPAGYKDMNYEMFEDTFKIVDPSVSKM